MEHRASLIFDKRDLGETVRRLRETRGISQETLAMQLGVGRMTVARLESGANVSIDTAMRAVSELGFTLAAVPKFSRVRIESDDA